MRCQDLARRRGHDPDEEKDPTIDEGREAPDQGHEQELRDPPRSGTPARCRSPRSFKIVPQNSDTMIRAPEEREAGDEVDAGARGVAAIGEDTQIHDRVFGLELVNDEGDERDARQQTDADDGAALEPVLAVALLQDELQGRHSDREQGDAEGVDLLRARAKVGSSMKRNEEPVTRRPSGTLTRKIQCQLDQAMR